MFQSVQLSIIAAVILAAPLGLHDDKRLMLIELGAWDGNPVLLSALLLRKSIRILPELGSSSPLGGEAP